VTTTTVGPEAPPVRRGAVLATICLKIFVISVDATVVNIALPALFRAKVVVPKGSEHESKQENPTKGMLL
jgi:hypothetical protein